MRALVAGSAKAGEKKCNWRSRLGPTWVCRKLPIDFNQPTMSKNKPINRTPDNALLGVSFGGGTNSTAMLCGFKERGIRPDLITFADTGSEMPHTYEHVEYMNQKVKEWWNLEIVTVRKTYQGKPESLEENCLRMKMLPSLAYGRKGCSQKFKIEPQDRYRKRFMDERGCKEMVLAMGFDIGEPHRLKERPPIDLNKGRVLRFWYPLSDWGWSRKECNAAVCRNKIPTAGKSACFFCPARKRAEILHLKKKHPDLFKRALKIEENAILQTEGRGLGGQSLRWEDVSKQDEEQAKLWDWLDEQDPYHMPCECHSL